MSELAISITLSGPLEETYHRVVEAIKPAGFGILTRIDFDKKMKEKLGVSMQPCIIAGACNPKLAYTAYQQSTDVALMIPCNIVFTEVEPGKIRVEAMKPTQMLNVLPEVKMGEEITRVESELAKCLASL